jgi:dTDP-4-amino-4,6-dideoxygalactose transaminase
MVFRVPESIDRDALIRALKAANVEATIGTYCLSGTTYFARKYKDVQPNALTLEARTITLPCYENVPTHIVAAEIARFIEQKHD